jgi:hypothetical protein
MIFCKFLNFDMFIAHALLVCPEDTNSDKLKYFHLSGGNNT